MMPAFLKLDHHYRYESSRAVLIHLENHDLQQRCETTIMSVIDSSRKHSTPP